MTVPAHSGRHAGTRPATELLGRAGELRTINAMLTGADPPGPCLLLRGDPGAGKTALLDAGAARAAAAGTRVLRAGGAPFETGIPFSALHQMLYVDRDVAGRLPDHQRDALAHVFGRGGGRDADPLVLATAVLALVQEIAAGRPLLVLADDVQWIDPASATVLGFLARRVGGTPVRFLAAVRTGTACLFDEMRLPERTVDPLPAAAAAALLDARSPGLPGVVRRRLLADAAGNPLALLELPGSLTDAQRSGQVALPPFLPLNGRLETTFAKGLAALADPARGLLLLAALDPEADLSTLRAAAGPHADVRDLAPARQAGLVTVDEAGDRLVFRHPLIRTAVVQLTSAEERRRAHQALAEALAASPAGSRGTAPQRRARHLADAATGPDETVARALDDVAQSAWGGRDGRPRASAAAAVSALVRASELSERPHQRSRRLVEAAFLANVTGQLDRVPHLLEDAGQRTGTATGLVFAATAHLLTNGECDIDAAQRLLARALDDLGDDAGDADGWDANGVLYALLFVSVYSGRPEAWRLLRAALERFDPRAVSALRLCYDAYADPAGATRPVQRLTAAFESLSTDPAPWQFIPLAYAAAQLDALAGYRHLCRRVIDRERDGGIVTVVITGLLILSVDSIVHGRWEEAERLAAEALDAARADGYHLLEGQIRCRQALLGALRGDLGRTRALTDEVAVWATPRGVGLARAMAAQASAIAALGRRDYEDAYVQAARVDPPGRPGVGVPGRWMVLDLVEAAVHIGHLDEARTHVEAARRAGIAEVSSRTALQVAGAAALVAPDAEADRRYTEALAVPDAEQWPFEHARIRLAYGEWLRRTRDTTAARLQLRQAVECLDRLGARPWADRARNELRAAGVATSRAGAATALTPQERQIATLAATGLTNKQIAEQLFLSHRTVGAHLHRAFPKLGVTSRAALAGALEAYPPEAG